MSSSNTSITHGKYLSLADLSSDIPSVNKLDVSITRSFISGLYDNIRTKPSHEKMRLAFGYLESYVHSTDDGNIDHQLQNFPRSDIDFILEFCFGIYMFANCDSNRRSMGKDDDPYIHCAFIDAFLANRHYHSQCTYPQGTPGDEVFGYSSSTALPPTALASGNAARTHNQSKD